MRQVANSVVKFLQAGDGPTAVKYAVMLALIIMVCIVCWVVALVLGKEGSDE